MKKLLYGLLLIVVIITIAIGVFSACNNNVTEPNSYTVEFGTQVGGRIEGAACQTISEGESAQKVVAIADNGYYFAGWADLGINSDETITQDERIINNVRESRYFYAMFERKTFQVEFVAGENGSIQGELVQSGKYGDDTSTVTAVPNAGYSFVGWSDGKAEPTRQDKFDNNKTLTANFKLITKTYTYNYKFADNNCDVESVSLTYGQLDNIAFPVPKREHGTFAGWYADKYLTQQVADEHGKLVIGNELFDNDTTQFYAKWVTENTAVYKILIVYVTELNATLMTTDKTDEIDVNYKMTDVERQICHMVTEKISFELNDLAVTNFVVDEYFTTIPLTEKNMVTFHDYELGEIDNSINATDIPEIVPLFDGYDCVMVSFSMNDYSDKLHSSGGQGGQ